jgi:hypothetical protein
MEEHIKKLKDKKYDESFGKTSMWLIDSNNKLLNRKNRRGKYKMKDFFLRHKLQFAIVALMAILIAACNMPVTQSDTVGQVLSWTAPGASNTAVTESLNKLSWFKNFDGTVDVKNINGTAVTEYKVVVQSTDDKLVTSYKNDLEKIKELTSIKIVPLNTSVTRPVYSAALHSFFKIDINASNMTDEQVQAEIRKQLDAAGYNDMDVSYKTMENGKKRLEVKMKDGIKHEGNQNLQVDVNDKNGEQVIKMKTMDKPDVDFSKMTDTEIRTYIKEKNKEDNLTDKDIIIKREGNSISVNIQKEEQK